MLNLSRDQGPEFFVVFFHNEEDGYKTISFNFFNTNTYCTHLQMELDQYQNVVEVL